MKNLKYLSLLLCAVMSLSLTACSDDGNGAQNLSQNELSLITGQSAKLIYNGDCTWESDEPLIADVDNNGNVTANRVGETTIWANDESCKVKVSPKYNTYMEPCIDWGASESEVTNFMNGYENLGKNGNTLGFGDMDNEIVYMYMFENNSLTASVIGANFISKGEEITDFLLERYVGLMMVIYMPFDVNSANTKTIISGLNKQIIQNNVFKRTPIDINILNDLMNKFKK